jgi:hypothetical protein
MIFLQEWSFVECLLCSNYNKELYIKHGATYEQAAPEGVRSNPKK